MSVCVHKFQFFLFKILFVAVDHFLRRSAELFVLFSFFLRKSICACGRT